MQMLPPSRRCCGRAAAQAWLALPEASYKPVALLLMLASSGATYRRLIKCAALFLKAGDRI